MTREDLFIDGKSGKLASRIKKPEGTPKGLLVLVQGANISGQLGYDLQVEGHAGYSFMDALVARGYAAVTFSLRGYYLSELKDDPHSVQTEQAIEDLESVLAWLKVQGFERPHLLGWSWGGRIAGRFVETNPDAIDRLVLLDPALGGGNLIPFPGKEPYWQNSYDYFYNRLEADFTHEDVRISVAKQASENELNSPNGIRVENENGSVPVRPDYITRPTLMIYGAAAGAQAYMHGAANRGEFLERIANDDKALVIVPGGGDYAHIQNPRAKIFSIVADFLAGETDAMANEKTRGALSAYRKTLTSLEDGSESAWWYLGTTIAKVEGHPDIIVNHVETVMVYGAQTLDGGGYRVPWWEIGLFRDAITGELPTVWTNPLTGAKVDAARQFEEGPSGFSVRATADGGIEMFDALQAFASLESAQLDVRTVGEKICITQTEVKTRSFPDPEGRIPDVSEGKAVRSRTVLQWLANRAEIDSDASSVPASGMYSFEIAAPAWLGFGDMPVQFAVRGVMHKAPMQHKLNPRGWEDLKLLYPQYFDGDEIRPRWK